MEILQERFNFSMSQNNLLELDIRGDTDQLYVSIGQFNETIPAPASASSLGYEDVIPRPSLILFQATRRTFNPYTSNSNEREVGTIGAKTEKLMSLSDLIRREESSKSKILPTPLLTHPDEMGDIDYDDFRRLRKTMTNGAVGTQEALQAAEHGNSSLLARFLQDGGDPRTTSRLHHMQWSLLHLAAGCAGMGSALSLAGSAHRSRPEPDCNDGYSACIALLLAAGADPNATSVQGGYTPLMGAAISGSAESCWLLLRAGANPLAHTDGDRRAIDFAQNTRGGGGPTRQHVAVIKVLENAPQLVPRSPLQVSARRVEKHEDEDESPCVIVRWMIPSQASLLPARCGAAERYLVKCWCNGQAYDVVPTVTGSTLKPRRDFCRHAGMDRGIALRNNLKLEAPPVASTIIHNLKPGNTYSFTVSLLAEVDGILQQSPPSAVSKPIFIPHMKDDTQWSVSGVLTKILPKMHGDGQSDEVLQSPSLQNLHSTDGAAYPGVEGVVLRKSSLNSSIYRNRDLNRVYRGSSETSIISTKARSDVQSAGVHFSNASPNSIPIRRAQDQIGNNRISRKVESDKCMIS